MAENENWPNLTHQNRDRLLNLCAEVGVDCTDKWISDCAIEAIGLLRSRLARLEAAVKDALPYIPDHIPRTTLLAALEGNPS